MTGSEYTRLVNESPQNGRRLLFDEYYGYVYTIVQGRLSEAGSREDVEECVSDVFAEAFRELEENAVYTGELKGIILTIAKRRAIDRFRSLSSRRFKLIPIDDDIDRLHFDYDLEEETERSQLQQLVMEKVEELGEPDSAIIIQRFFYNRSSREIAEALSMKPSAVRMRCSRALKRLRAALSECGIE